MKGRLRSIQTGTVRPLRVGDRKLMSAIGKTPVPQATAGPLGLEGDEQADFSVHGGMEKAVYAYPSEHYSFWNELLKREVHRANPIGHGYLGENLTVEGFNEAEVWVGDIWLIGEVELQVVKLREPCFKFNARMAYKGSAKAMIQSAKSGWYLQVNTPGTIKAGDQIEVKPGRREVSIENQNAFLLRKEQQKELF